MAFLGMDPEQVREHAQQIRTGCTRLGTRRAALEGLIAQSEEFWRGEDAEQFRRSWHSGAGALWREGLERLGGFADTADQDADEQERTSDPGGATGGSGGSTGDAGTTADGTRSYVPRGPLSSDGPLVTDEVAEAWSGMTDEERRKVAQEIVDSHFEDYGMEPVELIVEDKGAERSGSWSEKDKRLTITEAWLEDPSSTAVFAHEVRHAAQSEFARRTDPTGFLWWRDDKAAEYAQIERDHGVSREQIESWRGNMEEYGGDYISPPEELAPDATSAERQAYDAEWNRYEQQPLEQDARAVGDGYSRGLNLDELREFQERAGVDPS